METKTRVRTARLSRSIMVIVFATWPSLIGHIWMHFISIKIINADLYTILCSVLAFIIGSGFTAASLLVTMPRENPYLKRLDVKHLIKPYTFVMLIPCLYGLLSFVTLFLCQQATNVPNVWLKELTSFFIYSSLLQFVWSIIILFLILFRSNKFS